MELGCDVFDSLFHTRLHLNWIATSYDALEAFVEDGFCHDGCGGGSVASDVARLAGNFANHASAHVFVDVFEVDFLSDCHPVLGDRWAAEALLKDDVTTLWSQRHLNGAGKFRNTAANRFAGFLVECNDLSH